MNSDINKKFKRPKQKTLSTTNPGTFKNAFKDGQNDKKATSLCPLAAKDSEWVDIAQSSLEPQPSTTGTNVSDEEEVLQLVECEDGPQLKPLVVMFPGLLDKDPTTLQGVLDKAMSTTEVTKHLVDLGQKANFTFMKKADRLIPKDKQWLESLTENSNSCTSTPSELYSRNSIKSNYDADSGTFYDVSHRKINKNREKQANPIILNMDYRSEDFDFSTHSEQNVTQMGQVINTGIAPDSDTSNNK